MTNGTTPTTAAAADRYLRAALDTLERARTSQTDALATAGAWVGEAVAGGHLLAVTGSGHSHMLAEEVFYRADDVLVVASNSGRNAYPVEAAMVGKRLGARAIALTSLPHARSVTSRHASGQRLFELADLVLDTGVPAGDAAIRLPGLKTPVGPLSTVIAAALLEAVVVAAVTWMLERGHEPAILRSANVDQDDGAEDPSAWSARIPPQR